MKHLLVLLIAAASVLVLASCAGKRNSRVGYGPYGIYPSTSYHDAPGGWDVYRKGGSTRVKYSE